MAKESKENLYWIAPGVVTVDGKKYGIDDALPIDKIEKEKLDRWKKAGKVGAKIAPVDVSTEIADLKELVATLAAKVSELEKELEDATNPAGDGSTGDGE